MCLGLIFGGWGAWPPGAPLICPWMSSELFIANVFFHVEGRLVQGGVRSNTCYVHPMVTPSAAQQLNHTLHPHVGIKGCGDHTIGCMGF